MSSPRQPETGIAARRKGRIHSPVSHRCLALRLCPHHAPALGSKFNMTSRL